MTVLKMKEFLVLSLCLLLAPSVLGVRGPLSLLLNRGNDQAQTSFFPRSSATCTMCTYVLDKVKLTLNDTAIQATIKEKALEMCGSLTADLAAECTSLVETYEPLVTQFIVEADSGHVCSLLGACTASSAPSPWYSVSSSALRLALQEWMDRIQRRMEGAAATALAPSPNDACDVCKMSVIEVHSLVNNPSVQASVVNFTKSLCAVFGDSYTATCQQYVDVYAPELFNLLEKFLRSDELCFDLGICHALEQPKGHKAMWSSRLEAVQSLMVDPSAPFHSHESV